jgi:hypothetical protein
VAGPIPRRTWRNTGSGWAEKSNWALPDFLADGAGKLRGGVFVDFDGDGLPDFIPDRWDVYCNTNYCKTTTQGYPWDCGCATTAYPNGNYGGAVVLDRQASPAVYLNKTREGSGWVKDTAHSDDQMIVAIQTTGNAYQPYSGPPILADWQYPHLDAGGKQDFLADIDGDGRVDLIHFGKFQIMPGACEGKSPGGNCLEVYQYRIDVILNKKSGWLADEDYSVLVPAAALNNTSSTYWNIKEVRDVNRDGLADIVTSDAYHADKTVFINTGNKGGGNYTGGGDYGSVWKMATNRNETPPWPVNQQPNLVN